MVGGCRALERAYGAIKRTRLKPKKMPAGWRAFSVVIDRFWNQCTRDTLDALSAIMYKPPPPSSDCAGSAHSVQTQTPEMSIQREYAAPAGAASETSFCTGLVGPV
jgi:hypothetical protein